MCAAARNNTRDLESKNHLWNLVGPEQWISREDVTGVVMKAYVVYLNLVCVSNLTKLLQESQYPNPFPEMHSVTPPVSPPGCNSALYALENLSLTLQIKLKKLRALPFLWVHSSFGKRTRNSIELFETFPTINLHLNWFYVVSALDANSPLFMTRALGSSAARRFVLGFSTRLGQFS
jgi:hypothetical protein